MAVVGARVAAQEHDVQHVQLLANHLAIAPDVCDAAAFEHHEMTVLSAPGQPGILQRPVFKKSRFCQGSGCVNKKGDAPKRAAFGYEREVTVFCKDHALDGMVDVLSRQCAAPGCGTQPSYGLELGKHTHCAKHAEPGMVNVVSRRCAAPGCDLIPSFGLELGKPTHCATHAKPGMANVMSRRCAAPGCDTQPSYGNLCFPCYAEANPTDPFVNARYKTETKLKLYLNELGAGITSTSTFNAMNVRGRRAPAWLGTREMDFSLFENRVNVECDGGQHKTDNTRFKTLAVEQQALDCETTDVKLTNGTSVLRKDQPYVLADRYDWRSVLKVMILFGLERAVAGAPVLVCARRDEADLSYGPCIDLMLETKHALCVYEMFLCEPGLVACVQQATGARTYWKVPEKFSLAALPEDLRLAPGVPRQLTMEKAFKRHKAC